MRKLNPIKKNPFTLAFFAIITIILPTILFLFIPEQEKPGRVIDFSISEKIQYSNPDRLTYQEYREGREKLFTFEKGSKEDKETAGLTQMLSIEKKNSDLDAEEIKNYENHTETVYDFETHQKGGFPSALKNFPQNISTFFSDLFKGLTPSQADDFRRSVQPLSSPEDRKKFLDVTKNITSWVDDVEKLNPFIPYKGKTKKDVRPDLMGGVLSGLSFLTGGVSDLYSNALNVYNRLSPYINGLFPDFKLEEYLPKFDLKSLLFSNDLPDFLKKGLMVLISFAFLVGDYQTMSGFISLMASLLNSPTLIADGVSKIKNFYNEKKSKYEHPDYSRANSLILMFLFGASFIYAAAELSSQEEWSLKPILSPVSIAALTIANHFSSNILIVSLHVIVTLFHELGSDFLSSFLPKLIGGLGFCFYWWNAYERQKRIASLYKIYDTMCSLVREEFVLPLSIKHFVNKDSKVKEILEKGAPFWWDFLIQPFLPSLPFLEQENLLTYIANGEEGGKEAITALRDVAIMNNIALEIESKALKVVTAKDENKKPEKRPFVKLIGTSHLPVRSGTNEEKKSPHTISRNIILGEKQVTLVFGCRENTAQTLQEVYQKVSFAQIGVAPCKGSAIMSHIDNICYIDGLDSNSKQRFMDLLSYAQDHPEKKILLFAKNLEEPGFASNEMLHAYIKWIQSCPNITAMVATTSTGIAEILTAKDSIKFLSVRSNTDGKLKVEKGVYKDFLLASTTQGKVFPPEIAKFFESELRKQGKEVSGFSAKFVLADFAGSHTPIIVLALLLLMVVLWIMYRKKR